MSSTSKNLYGVLGISAAADSADLKRAYRRMLRKSHPDLGGSPEHFREVQEAWTVLGDVARRTVYDRGLVSEPVFSSRSRQRASATPPPARERPPGGLVDSHGHAGGSSRARYLHDLKDWFAQPVAPTPPQAPKRTPRLWAYFAARALRLLFVMTGWFSLA